MSRRVSGSTSNLPCNTPHDQASTLFGALWRTHDAHHLIVPGNDFRNIAAASVTHAVAVARAISDSDIDAYFPCAEYLSNTRKAANASGAWALWADLDVGESKARTGQGYTSIDDARSALRQFCNDTGLPEPTHIVSSGGGLHVYWVLSDFLARDRWQSYARKLKHLTERCAFKADGSRTADIASLLRVPGTLNFKYDPPRPVMLTHASAKFISTEAMLDTINAACLRLGYAAAPASLVRSKVTSITRDEPAAWSPFASRFLALLASALKMLDPDCEERIWALRRIAPLAEAARTSPKLRDELYQLARSWSSGALRGSPSAKWARRDKNGRTGEEVFEKKWNRFLRPTHPGVLATVGTIFADATDAGWVEPEEEFAVIDDAVEGVA
jgi:hypothetical protein